VPLNPALLPLAQSGGTRQLVDNLARTPLSHVVILVVILTALRMAIFPALINTKPHLRHGMYPLLRYANEILDALVYAAVFVFMVIRPFAIQAFLIPSGSMWPTLNVNDFIVANKAVYRYSNPKVGDIVVFRPPKAAAQSQSDLDPEDGEVAVDFIKRCIGTPGDLIEIKKGVMYRNGVKVDEPYIHVSHCTKRDGIECQDFADLTDTEKEARIPQNFKFVRVKGQLIPLDYTDRDVNLQMPYTGSFLPDAEQYPYNIAGDYAAGSSVLPSEDDALKAESLPAEKIPAGEYLMMGDNRNNSFDGRAWGLVTRDRIIGRSEFIWLPVTRWRITR
jgi:signal peptidase I